MSGGHFDYKQYELGYIADEIRELIDKNGSDELDQWGYKLHSEYTEKTIDEFRKAVYYLELAKLYTHRIDWLVSGDDGEDSFHRRLATDKQKILD
jgi:hypothetical protein